MIPLVDHDCCKNMRKTTDKWPCKWLGKMQVSYTSQSCKSLQAETDAGFCIRTRIQCIYSIQFTYISNSSGRDPRYKSWKLAPRAPTFAFPQKLHGRGCAAGDTLRPLWWSQGCEGRALWPPGLWSFTCKFFRAPAVALHIFSNYGGLIWFNEIVIRKPRIFQISSYISLQFGNNGRTSHCCAVYHLVQVHTSSASSHQWIIISSYPQIYLLLMQICLWLNYHQFVSNGIYQYICWCKSRLLLVQIRLHPYVPCSIVALDTDISGCSYNH